MRKGTNGSRPCGAMLEHDALRFAVVKEKYEQIAKQNIKKENKSGKPQ